MQQDFTPNVRYYIFARREGRGWKLANGNLPEGSDVEAARLAVAAQNGVVETRVSRVTTETV